MGTRRIEPLWLGGYANPMVPKGDSKPTPLRALDPETGQGLRHPSRSLSRGRRRANESLHVQSDDSLVGGPAMEWDRDGEYA